MSSKTRSAVVSVGSVCGDANGSPGRSHYQCRMQAATTTAFITVELWET